VYKIKIKPLSSNEAWKGKRFKTPLYTMFQQEFTLKLPRKIDIPDGPLKITFVFGFSNSASDYDNAIKQAQDVIASKYGFNDKRIDHAVIHKVRTAKGEEFIWFNIEASSPLLEIL